MRMRLRTSEEKTVGGSGSATYPADARRCAGADDVGRRWPHLRR